MVFESVLKVTAPQTGDVTYILFGEPDYPGCKVECEGQLNKLRCCGEDGGRIVGRQRLRLQIRISQLLEGRVRHPLEEAAQGGVVFQLGIRRGRLSVTQEHFDL